MLTVAILFLHLYSLCFCLHAVLAGRNWTSFSVKAVCGTQPGPRRPFREHCGMDRAPVSFRASAWRHQDGSGTRGRERGRGLQASEPEGDGRRRTRAPSASPGSRRPCRLCLPCEKEARTGSVLGVRGQRAGPARDLPRGRSHLDSGLHLAPHLVSAPVPWPPSGFWYSCFYLAVIR